MANQLLINLVNSILGEGKNTAKNNVVYYCPFCKHHKRKLEINFTENKEGINKWHCWVCELRGTKLIQIFKKLKVDSDKIQQLKSYVKIYDNDVKNLPQDQQPLTLPKEYKIFENNKSIISKHALNYCKKRGVSKNDIIKYQIGYCESGPYKNMIILPSFDENGILNYFTGRSFEEEMTGEKPFIKYKNPENTRDIVPFELYINWSLPITICEGFLDAIAIKRNAIPLLGKNIQSNLMKKLISSKVEKIYIALDKDAIKQSFRHCEMLMDEGKEVYLVDLEDKDPNQMGFNL